MEHNIAWNNVGKGFANALCIDGSCYVIELSENVKAVANESELFV